jgi:hypothetical protein
VFQHRAPQRRRNNNAHPAGNFRKDVTSTLGDFRRGIRPAHFVSDPLAILDRQRGLRSNLLSKKTVSRGGGDASGRSVRLIKIPAVLQIRHDVANRCRAERFLKTLGNGARRDGFARLDVGAHQVRQNLAVTPFL